MALGEDKGSAPGRMNADLCRYGLLHRIPRPTTPATTAPGADGYFGPDYTRSGDGVKELGTFIPAEMGRQAVTT